MLEADICRRIQFNESVAWFIIWQSGFAGQPSSAAEVSGGSEDMKVR